MVAVYSVSISLVPSLPCRFSVFPSVVYCNSFIYFGLLSSHSPQHSHNDGNLGRFSPIGTFPPVSVWCVAFPSALCFNRFVYNRTTVPSTHTRHHLLIMVAVYGVSVSLVASLPCQFGALLSLQWFVIIV